MKPSLLPVRVICSLTLVNHIYKTTQWTLRSTTWDTAGLWEELVRQSEQDAYFRGHGI